MAKQIHSIEKAQKFDLLKGVKTFFPSYTIHMIRIPDAQGHLADARLDLETIIPIAKNVAGVTKYYLVPATAQVDLKKASNMIGPLTEFTDKCIHIQNTYKVTAGDWEHEEFKAELNPLQNILKFKKGEA